jgi:hypothetical protein
LLVLAAMLAFTVFAPSGTFALADEVTTGDAAASSSSETTDTASTGETQSPASETSDGSGGSSTGSEQPDSSAGSEDTGVAQSDGSEASAPSSEVSETSTETTQSGSDTEAGTQASEGSGQEPTEAPQENSEPATAGETPGTTEGDASNTAQESAAGSGDAVQDTTTEAGGTQGGATEAGVDQGGTSGTTDQSNPEPVSDPATGDAAGSEIPESQDAQNAGGSASGIDATESTTGVTATAPSGGGSTEAEQTSATSSGGEVVTSADGAQDVVGGDESVVQGDVSPDGAPVLSPDGAPVTVNDTSTAAALPNLTPQEIDQVETALDGIAQVQDALNSSDITSATTEAYVGSGALDNTSLLTEADNAQLTEDIATALEIIESSSPNSLTAEDGSLIPVAETVDQGVTEQLFITDAGVSTALGEVAELLQADALSLGSEPITTAEVTIAATEQGTLVQVIHTSQWDPASPDPAGITYLPGTDRLLISDSEVDEMAMFQGVNLYEATRTGTLTNTGLTFSLNGSGTPTSPANKEPTGLGFNPADGTLVVSSDDQKRIYMIQPGADGSYGTADDQQTGSINLTTFGVPIDAEGVEFDTNSGHVFIVDGTGQEVWRVDPGPNGTFGDADDAVSSFDVGQYGARDPEGICSVTARDNLLIVDQPSNSVYELTKSGELVRTISLSALSAEPAPRRLAGITLAPGSLDPSVLNMWITARGVDNDANPNENDGRIFEIGWPSAPLVTDPPPPPPPPTSSTLVIPITAGRDDAEEKTSTTGAVARGQKALDLGVLSGVSQTVGLRFTGVTVPEGATIVSAYVQFQTRVATSTTANFTIQGEASDNASRFTTTARNISSRPRTTAAASWSPAPWTVVGEAGVNQRTTDLSAILQEIINRPGWTSGNAIVLIITGTGRRVAEAFEGANGPELHIEFIESGTTTVAAVVSSSPEGPPVGEVVEEVIRDLANSEESPRPARSRSESCGTCLRESDGARTSGSDLSARSERSGDNRSRYDRRARCRTWRSDAVSRRSTQEGGRRWARRCARRATE